MTAKRTAFIVSSFLILPILYVFFYSLHFVVEKDTITEWLPRWDRIAIIGSIIVLERIYTYRYAVSQRAVLARDLIANVVNLYGTGALTALIVLPAVSFVPMYFLGRKALFASPDQLGPLWLQIGTIFLIVSFFRYWMHRFQHENEFLWSFHAYHHSVTDLKAINGYVSHPIDYALRNILIFILLGAVGFDAAAILISITAMAVITPFQHCGADIRGGFLNYVVVTPEVHRWHHTTDVPKGYGHAVNYGVEFMLWDMLFGTYYLPKENGRPVQPMHIGHPGGLPDEGNYARMLLKPLGLWPSSWGERKQQHVPAE